MIDATGAYYYLFQSYSQNHDGQKYSQLAKIILCTSRASPSALRLANKADNDKSPLGISLRVATRHRAAVAP